MKTGLGKIIWETKRAENWSNKWIPKLKDDQQAASAELAVLVSTVFPADVHEPFLQMDGVWLVRPNAVRPVAEALRTDPDDADELKLHTNTAVKLLSEGYTILAGEKGTPE